MDDFRCKVRQKLLVLCVSAAEVLRALEVAASIEFDAIDDALRRDVPDCLQGAQFTAFCLRYFGQDVRRIESAYAFQRDDDDGEAPFVMGGKGGRGPNTETDARAAPSVSDVMIRNSNRALQRLIGVARNPKSPLHQNIARAYQNVKEIVQ
jgi:hypothetical protein